MTKDNLHEPTTLLQRIDKRLDIRLETSDKRIKGVVVQKQVGGLHDLARATTYESNKREIDEVKTHLKLDLTPAFGSQ